MVYLLDVNLLLALCDPRHVHHEAGHAWFRRLGDSGWASCPLTENGFVRIASHLRYPNRPGGPPAVAEILREFCRDKRHQFWPDSLSLLNSSCFRSNAMLSHEHITDIYLLALAVRNKGKLATFDQKITVAAVVGGENAVEVIKA